MMRRFQWPRLYRRNDYDPPTLLDSFLPSPLRALIQYVYVTLLVLRGAPFKPPRNKPSIRIVCISDTHTHTPWVPDGDVLIHAGDLTHHGTVEEIQAQFDWINSLPHKHKIVIAGNHDSYFDPKSRKFLGEESGAQLKFYDINYLQNQSLKLDFEGNRTLNFFGSPDIPTTWVPEFAFQYERHLDPWDQRIPLSTDVLITHAPPRYHLDNDKGCAGLLAETWRVRPRLHVFGHIHAARGRQTIFWDRGQAAFERLMARKKQGIIRDLLPSWAWWEAWKVVWYEVTGILWQHLMLGSSDRSGGLLVNAAMVSWQSSHVIAHPAEVVLL